MPEEPPEGAGWAGTGGRRRGWDAGGEGWSVAGQPGGRGPQEDRGLASPEQLLRARPSDAHLMGGAAHTRHTPRASVRGNC